jgi:hypothetical protein
MAAIVCSECFGARGRHISPRAGGKAGLETGYTPSQIFYLPTNGT